jgi:hypothetical protein
MTVGRVARIVPRHGGGAWKNAVRCAAASLLTPVLAESTLGFLILLVPVVLDHVLGTVQQAAKRRPVVPMLSDPSHESCALLGKDLVPVQAGLEVVVPPLTALLCVSGTMVAGDFDPVDLGLGDTPTDQSYESFIFIVGPRPSLLAWAAGALVCGDVVFHDDGDMCMGGCGDDGDDNWVLGHASYYEAGAALPLLVLVSSCWKAEGRCGR